MYKEYQIFEIIQNDINNAINESLGISEVVSSEANRVCNALKDAISQSEKTLIASGVGYRSGSTRIELFKDSSTVKGADIPPLDINFKWEYYNFKDKQYKAKFVEKNNITTGGNSVLITNHFKRKGKSNKGFVTLTIFSVSGNIEQNTFVDTIGHELRHILETAIPSVQLSGSNLMATVKSKLNSQNYYARLVAYILYLCDKHEITAFMQGFYEFVNVEKWKYGSVDKAVEHSDSYNLMLSLKEKIIEAESLMGDDEFVREVDSYKKFGISCKNFLQKVNGHYDEIIRRIGKVIVKCKENFILEGLHCGIGYFTFHTSFFRKKMI